MPEHQKQRMEDDPDFAYESNFVRVKARREARAARLAPEFKRISDGIAAYQHKTKNDTPISSIELGSLSTSYGVPTDRIVVEFHFYYLQDLYTALQEDLIPSCIAGVPVHIVVGEYFETYVEAGIR